MFNCYTFLSRFPSTLLQSRSCVTDNKTQRKDYVIFHTQNSQENDACGVLVNFVSLCDWNIFTFDANKISVYV